MAYCVTLNNLKCHLNLSDVSEQQQKLKTSNIDLVSVYRPIVHSPLGKISELCLLTIEQRLTNVRRKY